MGNLARYRAAKRALLEKRGKPCESCGEYAEHPHHIIPCSQTGIASELVYLEENMMVLCGACHALMHPGARRYWTNGTNVARARDLTGRSRRKI